MTWPEVQLPANLLILRVGAPNLLAFIVCAWGIVGAATGMFLRTAQPKLRRTAWGLVSLLCRAALQCQQKGRAAWRLMQMSGKPAEGLVLRIARWRLRGAA